MENPLVSIFVASYNNAHFIAESLDSVKEQDYRNIELIIVDDASTDNSVEVINAWIRKSAFKCKLVINKSNKGICASSNVFLAHAS